MSAKRALTPQDRDLVRTRFMNGQSIKGIAREFDVGTMTIRRIVDPEKYPMPVKDEEKHGKKRRILPHAVEAREKPDMTNAVVISDCPDTLTGLICGDPSPMRRRLMAEGRV